MNPQNLKPFAKGQSGNPGGRPKGIAALARVHTGAALDVLVNGLTSKDERVQQTAATALLDRGWGKPIAMTADVTKRLDEFTDDDIDAGLAALRATISSDSDAGERTAKATKH